MDFNQFIQRRRPEWERLRIALDRVEKGGMESLSPDEAEEFFSLYRLASSDLNLAQTRSANPALLEFLEGLVGRAWANIAAPRLSNPIKALWRVLRHRFPAAIRAEWRLFAFSMAVFCAGALFAFAAAMMDEKTAGIILPPEHMSQRPSERVQELEAMERMGKGRVDSAGEHAAFTSFLFTHNIRVTGLVFALGLTYGVGTVVLLFYNGAMLGALAALYLNDGVILFFAAWIGPHGAIELPCVFLGAVAGLMMARAQYRRDLGPLWAQVRAMRPRMVHIFIGTAALLVVAGIIEGGFSQRNEPTIPYPFKVAVAVALFSALLIYLFKIPVRPEEGAGR
jgi:uncharacterized membrane protein SpoIIM required for sporulation